MLVPNKFHSTIFSRPFKCLGCGIVRFIIIIFILLGSFRAYPQYYVVGQDPAGIRWRQMETDKFILIYPDYYESKIQALRAYCDTFAHYNYLEMDMPFSKSQTKTPIVFHSFGVYSNGMSAWAPKRMEFWTMPPQISYSQQWLQQLLLHEYRHELQMEAVNQSGIGVATSIFGQHIVGAITGLMVPMWYLEGDATWAETILSYSGRGRQGSFIMPYRTLLDNDISYSYSKAVFGSYKDYVPDYYHIGYLLTAWDRITETYYWKNGFQSVASKFWTLKPMYKGNFVAHYDSAMAFWKEYWKTFPSDSSTTAKRITNLTTKYSDYVPVGEWNSKIIAMELSLDKQTSLTLIDTNGGEDKIKNISNIYDSYFSQHGNKVAYAEMVPDKRWNVIYNNLVIWDLTNNKTHTIVKYKNIFSPSFSDSGKLVALEVCDTGMSYLLMFDTLFNQQKRILLPSQYQYSNPIWSQSEDTIFMTTIAPHGGNSISCYDTKNGVLSAITNVTFNTISNLNRRGDDIFYIADYSSVPQVYSYNLSNNKTYRHTLSKYGVGRFLVSADKIVYSDYTAKGYTIVIDTLKYILYNDTLCQSIIPAIDINAIPPLVEHDTVYQSAEYSKIKHLFNFHSWAPLSISPSNKEVDLGVSVFSQNVLSTSMLSGGWQYDHNTTHNRYYLDYEYAGWYPIINIGANCQQYEYGNTNVGNIQYLQLQSYIAATLPCLLVSDGHYYSMSFTSQFMYATFFEDYDNFDIEDLSVARMHSSFIHHSEKPYQYIYHPWLQSVSMSYLNGIQNSDRLFAIAGKFYFPSPITTHSIGFYAGYQYLSNTKTLINSPLQLARGYRYIRPQLFTASLAFDYTMPLLYPDMGIFNIMYIKRIYADLFVDCMFDKSYRNYYSIGLELNANLNVFQVSTPVTIGFRTSYLPQFSDVAFDLLFNVDI